MLELLKSIPEYIKEAVGAVIAFLGGVVAFLVGLILSYYDVTLPGKWSMAGGLLLMVWGQFWAYHKQRLRHVKATEDAAEKLAQLEDKVRALSNLEPDLDERLEILSYKPRLIQHTDWDRQTWETFNMDPEPDHFLEVIIGARVELDATGVVVECNGPIYRAGAFWLEPMDEIVASIEHCHRLPERVLVPFLKRPLPARTVFTLHLYGETSTRLVSVKTYKQGAPRMAASSTPPAGPPPTKSGS